MLEQFKKLVLQKHDSLALPVPKSEIQNVTD